MNDSVSGECNNINGAVIARSIGVSVINTSQCYSSQLIVFASDEIIGNNGTVTCLHFNGTNENAIDTLLMGNTGTRSILLHYTCRSKFNAAMLLHHDNSIIIM